MDIKPNISGVHATSAALYTHPSVPNTSDTIGPPPPTIIFTHLPLPQLPKANTPMVRYWFEAGYNGARKSGKNGEASLEKKIKGSILSCYMEDENGDEIPEVKRKQARSAAKGFFNLLLELGRAPPVWGSAGIDVQNEYLHIMESSFPFL